MMSAGLIFCIFLNLTFLNLACNILFMLYLDLKSNVSCYDRACWPGLIFLINNTLLCNVIDDWCVFIYLCHSGM